MKKILLSVIFMFSCSVFAGENFELDEMHQSAKVGIAWFLQQEGKAASSVRGYSIGKRDDGAVLQIFFKGGDKAKLFCHFHEEDNHDDHHDDHDHDHDHHHAAPTLADIDCHVLAF